jgi:glycine dehydrogenase subunit 1
MTEDIQFTNFPYLPHTGEERQQMLAAIGVKNFEELVSHIPADVRVKALELAEGLSELELSEHIGSLAAKNKPASQSASFLGGGSYRRFVPAVVSSVLSRSEFSTAYTPYQPEVSQGSLQVIYEFQTAICLLTGMEVANASMYDGPTACAEAAMMAARLTGRKKIVVSKTVNPEYVMVTQTYVKSCGLEFAQAQSVRGVTNVDALGLDDTTAALVVQYPNYFGCLEDLAELAGKAHEKGVLLVVISEPISLGLLESPGAFGADIVVGDAQPCGNWLSFGGPSAGYMACRKDFVRQLPGRLAGMTVDNRGNQAFTLTLQTREQHIRRAKATSNICTNQALNALAMLVYVTALGPRGLHQLSSISTQRAHYLADRLAQVEGVKLTFEQPFLNEFAVTVDGDLDNLCHELKERGILAGLRLSTFLPDMKNQLLIAVTEMNHKADLDRYVTQLQDILSSGKKSVPAQEKRAPAVAAKSNHSN